ncbi:hypothetical protein HPG69_011745 [Diceros bicornis minor]|uniref:E3 SUMO-protein ligase NSE2 n=1 Tax=Diceros bicornis minor TaxID=77932 RepID=A0A7J7EHI2_DICBM|nr:hypothetical protein HPG69_011745 [Diceros bicornis minor]
MDVRCGSEICPSSRKLTAGVLLVRGLLLTLGILPQSDFGYLLLSFSGEFQYSIRSQKSASVQNKPYGLQADREADGTEGVDEDMIVTQSQTNFICPITQVEMKKPVKNKVCGHTYEEEAIVRMIESKHRRKKKACCPKIGCSHTVRMSDLIQDEALRRAIESHNKKKHRHSE